MDKEVQYPFAFNEEGVLTSIDDVREETRHDHTYYCPACKHQMLPRLGKKNAHCFAHSENHKCGLESYIHKTAKHILAERFNDPQIPFTISLTLERTCKYYDTCPEERSYICSAWRYKKQFELTQYYNAPAEEEVDVCESDGATHFRPDVLLKSRDEKRQDIFIEVYHKSKSKEKKTGSGHRIIEIRIRDFEALKALRTQEFFEESKDIVFYNFEAPRATPDQIVTGIKDSRSASYKRRLSNDDLPPCKQSESYKRQHYHLQRYVLMKDGRRFVNGIYENELDVHYQNALIDITYDQKTIKNLPPFDTIIGMKLPNKRTCYMCEHCCPTEMVTWCKALKNGTTRKNTFKPEKGATCFNFELSSWTAFQMKQFEEENNEGDSFSIWINPNQE